MTTTVLKESDRIPKFLVTTERCDGCSSKAYTMAVKDKMFLYFCGHHTNKHKAALMDDGWELEIRLDVLNKENSTYKVSSDDNF